MFIVTMSQKLNVHKDGTFTVRPFVNNEQIKEISNKCFGLRVNETEGIKEAISYDDRNFILKGKLIGRGNADDDIYKSFDRFVLKIYNGSKSNWVSSYQNINKMISEIYPQFENKFKVPFPIRDVDSGETCVLHDIPLHKNVEVCEKVLEDLCLNNKFVSTDGLSYYVTHIIRLTAFIPGHSVDIKTMDDGLAFELGQCAAMLTSAFKKYPEPQIKVRVGCEWDMENVRYDILNDPYIISLKNQSRKETALKILEKYENLVLRKLQVLPRQWIHGDVNDLNFLVDKVDSDSERKIVGIIDFDEVSYSYRVLDIGTTLMYITHQASKEQCLQNVKYFLKGYTSISQLDELEKSVLFTTMLARYIQSCVIGEYEYYFVDPENEYLLHTPSKAWETLDFLMKEGESKFQECVASACN